MKRRSFIAASVLLAATSLVAVAQDAPLPDYYPTEYADIIEASRGEQGLVVYGNMSADAWSGALARFSELYPWIRVETLDLSSTELFERYLAEKGTGSRSADLLVSTAQQNWLNLISRGEVLDYVSPETSELPELAALAPGLYAIAVDPAVFVWNKLTLPADKVPTSLADLAAKVEAEPDFWRGKITTYDPTSSGTGYQSHYAQIVHHGDVAWEWFETIAPMVRGETSNGPMLEKVITGEYLLAYNSLPSNIWFARDPAALEAIVDWSFVGDGSVCAAVPSRRVRPARTRPNCCSTSCCRMKVRLVLASVA